MNNKKLISLLSIFLTAFLCLILLSGCKAIDEEFIEYKGTDLAYDDGDDCFERYLLYEDEGRYERWIGGTYKGHSLSDPVSGTLFETGKITIDYTVSPAIIKFSPKTQYNFDTGNLKTLGTTGQVPYYGKLTDEKLVITWQVYIPHQGYGYVDYEFERN